MSIALPLSYERPKPLVGIAPHDRWCRKNPFLHHATNLSNLPFILSIKNETVRAHL